MYENHGLAAIFAGLIYIVIAVMQIYASVKEILYSWSVTLRGEYKTKATSHVFRKGFCVAATMRGGKWRGHWTLRDSLTLNCIETLMASNGAGHPHGFYWVSFFETWSKWSICFDLSYGTRFGGYADFVASKKQYYLSLVVMGRDVGIIDRCILSGECVIMAAMKH